MRAQQVFVALALVSASAARGKFDIQEAGRVYQMGSYPYLKGFAGKPVNSKLECEEACRKLDKCAFGTYVTKDAETSDGYNYQKTAKAGECWLSAQTHTSPTACGVPCVGFRKVKATKPLTPAQKEGDEFCTKDVKTCWDHTQLSRISYKECAKWGVDRKECKDNACNFGFKYKNSGPKIHWGCKQPRDPCMCDPSLHPSHFNKCHQDPWSRHIVVTHLPRRFHARAFEEGARHRCAMVGGKDPVCQCCTCMSEVKPIRNGFVDLGREAHPVLDGASYTTIEGVASFDECVAKCGRDCKWGSFIARKNKLLNSCVVASTAAAKTASGKLRTAQCPGKGEKCHSFLHPGLSDKAVDLGNSKAFIRKGDADIANPADRKSKQDFVKCAWNKKNRKCVATDRSTVAGLTGKHKTIPLTFVDKTIPGAHAKWCKEHQASHHNMEWVAASKECHYGCNTIHSEKECNGAEDHFKIEDGARPCRKGKYWDTASETCIVCKANEYQWHVEHFLDSCYQCPYADGQTKFKDDDEARQRCLNDCVQQGTRDVRLCEYGCRNQCHL